MLNKKKKKNLKIKCGLFDILQKYTVYSNVWHISQKPEACYMTAAGRSYDLYPQQYSSKLEPVSKG